MPALTSRHLLPGTYFNEARAVIAETKAADHLFTLQGGSFAAGFVDAGGNRLGMADGSVRTA